jgi:2-polyprenyl-6-hydroxyphenyl methylase/3-demethylubiquinone-9 3-methyltransferase
MRLTQELREELKEISRLESWEVGVAPVQMWWEGIRLTYGSLYPPKPILFRGGLEYFLPLGHGETLKEGLKTYALSGALIHDDRKGFFAYVESQVRYSDGAVLRLGRGEVGWRDRMRAKGPIMVLLAPIYSYILRGGVFSGRIGLLYSVDRIIAETIRYRTFLQAGIKESGKENVTKKRDAVEFHNELATGWEKRYEKGSFRTRSAALLGLLKGPDLRGQKWLDVGCGTGTLGRILAKRGCQVYCLDAAQHMLAMAREFAERDPDMPRLRLEVLGGAEGLPFGDSVFDGILCSSVIEYLSDPKVCLREFSRVLKGGGALLISAPNRHSLIRISQKLLYRFLSKVLRKGYPDYLGYSINEYSVADFSSELESEGFCLMKTDLAGIGISSVIDRLEVLGPMILVSAGKIQDRQSSGLATRH